MQSAFGGAVAMGKAEKVFKYGCGLLVALIVLCALGWFLWTVTSNDAPPDDGDATGQNTVIFEHIVVDRGATWDCSRSPDVHRVSVGGEVVVVDSEPIYGCELVAIIE